MGALSLARCSLIRRRAKSTRTVPRRPAAETSVGANEPEPARVIQFVQRQRRLQRSGLFLDLLVRGNGHAGLQERYAIVVFRYARLHAHALIGLAAAGPRAVLVTLTRDLPLGVQPPRGIVHPGAQALRDSCRGLGKPPTRDYKSARPATAWLLGARYPGNKSGHPHAPAHPLRRWRPCRPCAAGSSVSFAKTAGHSQRLTQLERSGGPCIFG